MVDTTSSSGPVVLVTRRLFEPQMRRLTEQLDLDVWEGPGVMPRSELLDRVPGADGLLCMLTDDIGAEVFAGAERLRVISQMAAGVDNIDLAAATSRGIPVGHTPDAVTETTADTAFALLAAVVRRLPEGREAVRAGEWGPWDPAWMLGGDLHGTTIGIIGLGRIGRALARRAQGFGMRILYHARNSHPDAEAELAAVNVPLDDLLSAADHVVVALPLSAVTRGIIDRDALRRMQPHSVLVNIARGPLVDQDALVEALSEGWIAGAGLDVTDPEPLPPAHPLAAHPRCLVIPHLGSASVRTRHAMADQAVDNLLAGLAGQPLPARAN